MNYASCNKTQVAGDIVVIVSYNFECGHCNKLTENMTWSHAPQPQCSLYYNKLVTCETSYMLNCVYITICLVTDGVGDDHECECAQVCLW